MVNLLEKDLSSLIGILERERDSYQELLDRARQEQQIILEGNMDELPSMVKLVEDLVCVSRDLEKERLSIISSISESLGSSQKVKSLSQLVGEIAPQFAEESDHLQDLQKEISKIVNELAKANRVNSDLLRRNLGYIDFLFSLLADEDQTYQAGSEKKAVSSKLFDQRI
jgi:flagellar biosynthesis/type III secretory pathway chaperone